MAYFFNTWTREHYLYKICHVNHKSVYGTDCIFIGDNNLIKGINLKIYGNNNIIIDGSNIEIIGNNNEIQNGFDIKICGNIIQDCLFFNPLDIKYDIPSYIIHSLNYEEFDRPESYLKVNDYQYQLNNNTCNNETTKIILELLDENIHKDEKSKKNTCIKCKQSKPKVKFIDCLHLCCCIKCTKYILLSKNQICPSCQKPISNILINLNLKHK